MSPSDLRLTQFLAAIFPGNMLRRGETEGVREGNTVILANMLKGHYIIYIYTIKLSSMHNKKSKQ